MSTPLNLDTPARPSRRDRAIDALLTAHAGCTDLWIVPLMLLGLGLAYLARAIL